MLAMFLSALEQTIVAPALPTIGRALGDVENLSWVVTAYLLAATAVTPLFGKLSDIHGRRRMMLVAIVIFIVGSVACALAPNMPALIAARALQGIGGGGILPIAHTIIGDMVSPRERPRYQSYTAIMFMAASIDRAGARRRADRLCALDHDLLDQPADRPAGAVDDRPRAEASCRATTGRTSSTCSAPLLMVLRGAGADAGDDLGRQTGGSSGWASRADPGLARGARRCCGCCSRCASRARRSRSFRSRCCARRSSARPRPRASSASASSSG